MVERGSFSIAEIISTEETIKITLQDNKKLGWYAELDLDARKAAQLVDQKYRISDTPIKNDIKDYSGFSERPQKLKSK